MNTRGEPPGSRNNVIDLASRRPRRDESGRILRIAPENDGLRMLYGNDLHTGQLMAIDIVGWALFEDGRVDALVPWLRDVVPAGSLVDPLNGHCDGCWDGRHQRLLGATPPHKVAELEAALAYFGAAANEPDLVVQDMPDAAGTHAVLSSDGFRTLRLLEVAGWQLRGDGRVLAMLVDDTHVTDTPVRLDDACLYPAQQHPHFRYFFQHGVANQLKRHDPDAMACLAMLAQGAAD
jgi:hypothetical protein